MKFAALLLALLLPGVALAADPGEGMKAVQQAKEKAAQQPGGQAGSPPKPGITSVNLAMQQLSVSMSMLIDGLNADIAARDKRIAELEKLCGDPCKPAP